MTTSSYEMIQHSTRRAFHTKWWRQYMAEDRGGRRFRFSRYAKVHGWFRYYHAYRGIWSGEN